MNTTVTYRTVQGNTSSGTIIDTHRMTGELLISDPAGHRAWVHADRVVSVTAEGR